MKATGKKTSSTGRVRKLGLMGLIMKVPSKWGVK